MRDGANGRRDEPRQTEHRTDGDQTRQYEQVQVIAVSFLQHRRRAPYTASRRVTAVKTSTKCRRNGPERRSVKGRSLYVRMCARVRNTPHAQIELIGN